MSKKIKKLEKEIIRLHSVITSLKKERIQLLNRIPEVKPQIRINCPVCDLSGICNEDEVPDIKCKRCNAQVIKSCC